MASSADFVLKAYKTEANARADSNPLAIDSATSNSGSTIDNPSQASTYGFWAFQRYWYRIVANEPVSEFHIDWDDGEDNSPKKANVSIIKTDKPSFVGIVSHIYTQSKSFYPLIRVKSVDGFLSKWYTPYSTSSNYDGLDDYIKTGGNDKGQNSFSVVSIEKSGSAAAATAALSCADGDDNTTDQFIEGDYLKITSTDGTIRIYVLCDNTNSGAPATGTILEAGDDTGHHILAPTLADLGICVAVSNNFHTHQQALYLNEIKAAILHANGHNGKITASSDVGSTDGAKTITLTQATVGAGGRTTSVVTTNPEITLANFTAVGKDFARIPIFKPANVPPVGVLKVDRKRIFSGIDNDLLGNNGRMLNSITPYGDMPYSKTVQAYCSNAARTGAQVKVTYQEGIIGGVSYVSSIQIPAKGGAGGADEWLAEDLQNAVMIITAMDEVYCVWWNVNGQQTINIPPSQYNAAIHVAVIANPNSTGGVGSESITTTGELVSSMLLALNAVKFPVTTGRFEFTVTGTTDGGIEQITITHNRTGKVKEAGAAISVANVGGVSVFDTTYGTSSVLTTTSGVDSSGGNIKQKTLTTLAYGSEISRITNVERILKAELVNNLESGDSYGGGADAEKLYPGERIYLLSTLNRSDATSLSSLGERNLMINLHNTICNVSLGNPIVELNAIGGSVLLDASESKVRCSNKSIDYYYFDDNKLISGDTVVHSGGTYSRQNHQMADTTDASFGITEKLVDGIAQKSIISTRELRYSHEWWREHKDANYRFYPQKRLVRCQIEDNHTQVADDSLSRSPIEHWNYTGYLTASAAAADPNNQPLEISKHNYGVFLFTDKAQLRAPNWVDLSEYNKADVYPIFQTTTSSIGTNLFNNLVASASFDTDSAAARYAPSNRGDAAGQADTIDSGPRNALFMAKKEKFDRIFIRVSHDLYNAAGVPASLSLGNIATDVTPGTTSGMPKVRLQILYPAKKTSVASVSEDKVVWKALSFIDKTKLKGKDDSTFYRSGDIIFTPPADWAKTSHTTMNPTSAEDTNIIYPFEDNFFEDGSGATGIDDTWTQDSYALIFLITVIIEGDELGKSCFQVMSMYLYNNPHSQLIEIVDPMHVSLNVYGIAQSVSFVRKGNYQEIKDRSGISLMRRVGAEGGKIKLGGIDLKGDPNTIRAKFHEFQNDAVPVYYDITHRDDSKTRLFGVMVDMSEDHPTGNVIPKFACSMTITHILEIDSSGNITGDGYRPLGGDVIDVEQYLSAS